MGCRTQRPHLGKMMPKPGPSTPSFDRALSFLDVLLTRATPIVESDDTLGRPRQISDDETDMRVQLARTPFDLGHNMARLVPALRHLVAWIGGMDALSPTRVPGYAVRTYSGRPRSSIRFST